MPLGLSLMARAPKTVSPEVRPSIAGPHGDRTRRLRIYGLCAEVARPPMYPCCQAHDGRARERLPPATARKLLPSSPDISRQGTPCARRRG